MQNLRDDSMYMSIFVMLYGIKRSLSCMLLSCVYNAGLCASVMKGASQPAMAAVSASTTASTFGGAVAESFMEMSCLPEGKTPQVLLYTRVKCLLCVLRC